MERAGLRSLPRRTFPPLAAWLAGALLLHFAYAARPRLFALAVLDPRLVGLGVLAAGLLLALLAWGLLVGRRSLPYVAAASLVLGAPLALLPPTSADLEALGHALPVPEGGRLLHVRSSSYALAVTPYGTEATHAYPEDADLEALAREARDLLLARGWTPLPTRPYVPADAHSFALAKGGYRVDLTTAWAYPEDREARDVPVRLSLLLAAPA